MAGESPSTHSRAFIDRTGERFGRLIAVEKTHRILSSGRKMPAWRLRCDCGNEVVAMTVNLMKGKHRSCGCLNAEMRRAPKPRKVRRERVYPTGKTCVIPGIPGKVHWPEYQVYRQMRDRCYLQTAKNYAWYGARGITVCDRWRFGENGMSGFDCFIADMGRRPDGLTLERIDNEKGYGPSNCKWATWSEQIRNRRNLRAARRQENAVGPI